MGVNLNPYLVLNGTAKEAMTFYADVLGGDLTVTSFSDVMGEGAPEGVMHAQLATPDGFVLMASDGPPGQPVTRGDDVAVSISGDRAEAMRGWWARLSEDGDVTLPLGLQPWGDEFGQVTDRFGVSWMINIAGSAL